MNRALTLALLALVLLAAAESAASRTPAFTPRAKYVGRTSQGLPITVRTTRHHITFSMRLRWTCHNEGFGEPPGPEHDETWPLSSLSPAQYLPENGRFARTRTVETSEDSGNEETQRVVGHFTSRRRVVGTITAKAFGGDEGFTWACIGRPVRFSARLVGGARRGSGSW